MTTQLTILVIFLYVGSLVVSQQAGSTNVGVIVKENHTRQLLLQTAENINNNFYVHHNLSLHFYEDSEISHLSRFSYEIQRNNVSAIFGEKLAHKQALFLSQFHRMPTFAVTDHTREKTQDQTYHFENFYVMLPSNKILSQLVKKTLASQNWTQIILLYTVEKGGELNTFLWECKDIVKHEIIALEFSGQQISKLTLGVIQKLALNIENPDAYVIFAEAHEIKILLETVKNGEILRGLFTNIILFNPVQNANLETDHETKIIAFRIGRESNYSGPNAASQAQDHKESAALLGDALIYYAHLQDKLEAETAASDQNNVNNKILYQKLANETQSKGITGKVSFDAFGHRKYLKFDIVNLRHNIFHKIGSADTEGLFVLDSTIQHNYEQSRTQINLGRPLKVVTLRSTPFLFRIKENDTYQYYGLFIDMLNKMAAIMNCTYEFYIVADKEYGRDVNGKWTGMVGDVLYRKADIAIAAMTVTSLRQAVVDFTRPYMNLEIVYVRKTIEEKGNQPVLFFQPFSTNVWLISAAMVVVISMVLYVVDYYSPYGYHSSAKDGGGHGRKLSLWNCVWFTATCTLQQGADRAPEALSGRIVIGFFWAAALITVSSYTANLAAYLTFKKTVVDTTNLEGFLKLNYSFSVVRTSALDSFFQASDYYVYRLMYEKIVAEKSFVTSSKYGIQNSRERENYIYIGEEPFVKKRLNTTPCDMVMVPGILPPMSFAFPVRKHSLLYHPVSNAIAKMLESGFIEKRRKYYFDETHKCRGKLSPTPPASTEDWRVGADSMYGVYMFLVAGACASVVALIWEHWWKRQIERRIENLATKVRVIGKTAVVVDKWKRAKNHQSRASQKFSFSWNVVRKRSESALSNFNEVTEERAPKRGTENKEFQIEELE